MNEAQVVFVLPVFGAFEYAELCMASLRRANPNSLVLVYDDASPDWDRKWESQPGWSASWLAAGPANVACYHFAEHGGLTRSWSAGVKTALQMDLPDDTLLVLGNSDVVVSADWDQALRVVLSDPKVAFTGPMTNCPGNLRGNLQDVRRLVHNYDTDKALRGDSQVNIDRLGARLWEGYGASYNVCDVAGFCIVGKLATYKKLAHNPDPDWNYNNFSFFPPKITVLPSGRKNGDPLNAGQEPWIAHRVKEAGLVTAAANGSFVAHYRAVSRGKRHRSPGWMRHKKT